MPNGQYSVAIDLPQEVWRIIPSFEKYAVSNFGRVKRVTPAFGTRPGRLLTPWLSRKGYPTVHVGRKREVHVLVALAFLGPRPEGYEINHKDAKPANSYLDNLEYVTHQRNMQHAAENGCFKKMLPLDTVQAIRQAREQGLSLNQLVLQFHLPKSVIWRTIKRPPYQSLYHRPKVFG